ncbi:programmed cell death 1 ligand 1-like [Thomomys bottae]
MKPLEVIRRADNVWRPQTRSFLTGKHLFPKLLLEIQFGCCEHLTFSWYSYDISQVDLDNRTQFSPTSLNNRKRGDKKNKNVFLFYVCQPTSTSSWCSVDRRIAGCPIHRCNSLLPFLLCGGYYDFFDLFTKLVYYFRDNTEQLEDQNSLYEGRVSVDRDEISEGTLSLLLRNVDFLDEAIYKCSAITPDGRGESTIKLIVEDFEMPQVQFDRIDDEDVATCISKGWYFTPNVTWMDRKERDLSNHSTVEVLEEQMNGLFRVFSVLKYPVKLNEIYVCRIAEADENHLPFRVVRKFPKRRYPGSYDFY